MYDGAIDRSTAAITTDETWPRPATISTATQVSDWKALNPMPEMWPLDAANSAPAIPARKAEMQKTSTRDTWMLAPWTVRATGDSASPSRRRPSRLRYTSPMATVAATTTARQT